MNQRSLVAILMAFANQLKFKNLFLLTLALFIIDLIVPDFIPMIDEIILGLLTLILANWKKESHSVKPGKPEGNVIEGEVIEKNNE